MVEPIDRNGDWKPGIEKALREGQGVSRGPGVFRLDISDRETPEIKLSKRNLEEIREAEAYLTNILWWNRSTGFDENYKARVKNGEMSQETYDEVIKGRKRIEEEIPEEDRIPKDQYEWGVICGKLSALRWVLGFDWDMLDS
jgi:hypothetical protein